MGMTYGFTSGDSITYGNSVTYRNNFHDFIAFLTFSDVTALIAHVHSILVNITGSVRAYRGFEARL
jgi:hypothetical protein